MTNFATVDQRNPETDNPVASFEVGIMTFKGTWVGVCIKFSMYDRKTKITHWPPSAFEMLRKSLEEYSEHLGANAFMFQAYADPSLVANLPSRHPYHTLLTEVPKLNESEIGTVGLKTEIDQVQFVIRGPTFEIRAVYSDGRSESILMHEYTALSLFGYLQQYMDAAAKLCGPAAGTA